MEKRKQNILVVVSILLLIAVGFLTWQYLKQKDQIEETVLAKEIIEERKTELEGELMNLHDEYDNLKTTNDSINIKLEEEQEKIQRLLSLNRSNAQKIKLYSKELTTLREVMRSYIVQIDSLNRRNQFLMAENVEVKNKLKDTETKKQELEEEKENLTNKVSMASILNAKQIDVVPMNRRSKEKYKINKIEKIKTCFTLRENPIIEPGIKTVYLRIERPDNVVLSNSDAELIQIGDDQLAYTASRDVTYENKDVDMCIYWDNANDQLIDGSYEIYLYESGNLIGNSTFELK